MDGRLSRTFTTVTTPSSSTTSPGATLSCPGRTRLRRFRSFGSAPSLSSFDDSFSSPDSLLLSDCEESPSRWRFRPPRRRRRRRGSRLSESLSLSSRRLPRGEGFRSSLSLALAFVTAGAWNIGTGIALAARFGFSLGVVVLAVVSSLAAAFFRRTRTFFSVGSVAISQTSNLKKISYGPVQ